MHSERRFRGFGRRRFLLGMLGVMVCALFATAPGSAEEEAAAVSLASPSELLLHCWEQADQCFRASKDSQMRMNLGQQLLLLAEDDPVLARQYCEDLDAMVGRMTAKPRRSLLRQVGQFLGKNALSIVTTAVGGPLVGYLSGSGLSGSVFGKVGGRHLSRQLSRLGGSHIRHLSPHVSRLGGSHIEHLDRAIANPLGQTPQEAEPSAISEGDVLRAQMSRLWGPYELERARELAGQIECPQLRASVLMRLLEVAPEASHEERVAILRDLSAGLEAAPLSFSDSLGILLQMRDLADGHGQALASAAADTGDTLARLLVDAAVLYSRRVRSEAVEPEAIIGLLHRVARVGNDDLRLHLAIACAALALSGDPARGEATLQSYDEVPAVQVLVRLKAADLLAQVPGPDRAAEVTLLSGATDALARIEDEAARIGLTAQVVDALAESDPLAAARVLVTALAGDGDLLSRPRASTGAFAWVLDARTGRPGSVDEAEDCDVDRALRALDEALLRLARRVPRDDAGFRELARVQTAALAEEWERLVSGAQAPADEPGAEGAEGAKEGQEAAPAEEAEAPAAARERCLRMWTLATRVALWDPPQAVRLFEQSAEAFFEAVLPAYLDLQITQSRSSSSRFHLPDIAPRRELWGPVYSVTGWWWPHDPAGAMSFIDRLFEQTREMTVGRDVRRGALRRRSETTVDTCAYVAPILATVAVELAPADLAAAARLAQTIESLEPQGIPEDDDHKPRVMAVIAGMYLSLAEVAADLDPAAGAKYLDRAVFWYREGGSGLGEELGQLAAAPDEADLPGIHRSTDLVDLLWGAVAGQRAADAAEADWAAVEGRTPALVELVETLFACGDLRGVGYGQLAVLARSTWPEATAGVQPAPAPAEADEPPPAP